MTTEVTPLETEDIEDVTEEEQVEDTEDEDSDEDPITSFQQSFRENEAAKIREELRAEVRAQIESEYAATERTRLDAEQRASINKSFEDSIKQTKELLDNLEIYDKDGDPVKFDEKAFQQFINPWQKHNLGVQQAATHKSYVDLAEAIVKILPSSARDEFAKNATNKPLDEYLKLAFESYAPHSGHTKTVDEDVKLKIKVAEARGFAKGQKAPPGSPHNISERKVTPDEQAPDLTTLFGAASALRKGQIDESKYREIHNKLRNS